MITGKSPATPKATSGMPPSSLPTRPLSQRDGPSDRFIDRLERIRRNAYEEEAEATQAPTTPTPARAPAEAPRNASAPAAPAAPAPAADTKGEDTVLSKLVKFFRQADGKKAEARPEPKAVPRPKTGAEAIIVPQTAYRTAPDIGPAKGELPSPAPLSPEALAATGKETEPQPGQSAGKMPPGFLDHLSQLFTDQKVAEKGWAAEVEILEPKANRRNRR